jgi:hypothetical protein
MTNQLTIEQLLVVMGKLNACSPAVYWVREHNPTLPAISLLQSEGLDPRWLEWLIGNVWLGLPHIVNSSLPTQQYTDDIQAEYKRQEKQVDKLENKHRRQHDVLKETHRQKWHILADIHQIPRDALLQQNTSHHNREWQAAWASLARIQDPDWSAMEARHSADRKALYARQEASRMVLEYKQERRLMAISVAYLPVYLEALAKEFNTYGGLRHNRRV